MNMTIRDMAAGEERLLWRLFHETIHTVNGRDYTPEQLQAWSPEDRDMEAWTAHMQRTRPFVAVADETIVGFSDVQPDGLVDFLFVHHAYQGRGVGTQLLNEVLRRAREDRLPALHSHVSITARGLFERFGFVVDEPQTVVSRGVEMTNFLMRKNFSEE